MSDKMTLLSQYKSNKVIAGSDPEWNERAHITATWNSQIVITIFDHNTLGRHQFLGQVSLYTVYR
jgi:hypothetical protein